MKTFLLVLITTILIVSFSICNNYYKRGYDKGICDVLDTVNTIIDNQLRSDTSVTKLVIVNPDTNIFFLSRRTIKIK